jgi:hypothetical protein
MVEHFFFLGSIFFFETFSTTHACGPQSLHTSLLLLNLEEEEASFQGGDLNRSLLLKQKQTLQTLSPTGPVAGGNFGVGFGEEEEEVGEEYQTVEWRRKTCSVNRYVGHELADYCGMRVEEEEEEIMPSMERKDFVRTLLRMRVRKLTLSLSHTHTHTLANTRRHTVSNQCASISSSLPPILQA